MANFGGPDAASAGLVVQAYQNRRKEAMQAVELGVRTGTGVTEILQRRESIDLDKRKVEIAEKELPSVIAAREADTSRAIVDAELKRIELDAADEANFVGKILKKKLTGDPLTDAESSAYKSTLSRLEQLERERDLAIAGSSKTPVDQTRRRPGYDLDTYGTTMTIPSYNPAVPNVRLKLYGSE